MRAGKCVLIAVVTAAMLGGCAGVTKEDQGTVLGGVLGGIGGSMLGGGNGRILGTIAGTFAGGYLGRTVGRYMDQQDQLLHERAVERTVLSGSNSNWVNPRTGHYGLVEAGERHQTQSGYCREYTETIIIDSRPTSAHGTACQERDGSWRIMNR